MIQDSPRVCVWKNHYPLSKELTSEGNLVSDTIIWTYLRPYLLARGGCLYISVLLFLLVSWIDVLKAHLSVLPSNILYLQVLLHVVKTILPSLFIKFYSKPKQGLELPVVSLEQARSIHSNLVLSHQLIICLQPMAAES